ncbi:ITA2B protein, partial [Urocolius indicus]|nr:ITA2B protein [Urocolius indicus]
SDLEAELQLDRLKPRLSRRVLLLQGHQPSWHGPLSPAPGAAPDCRNLTAYLRDEADFKDKLSPVVLSLSLALPEGSPGLVLYGDTVVQAQVGNMLGWGHPTGAHLGIPSPGFLLPPFWPGPAVPSMSPVSPVPPSTTA